MAHFELANEIAVLSGGRRAEWTLLAPSPIGQGLGTGVPSGENAGVALGGSLKTLVALDLRSNPTNRRSEFRVTNPPDFGAVYAIEIDGTRVNYDAGGAGATTVAEIIQGLADAINADGTLGPLVLATATDTDDDSAVDVVVVTGKTTAHYTIDFSPGMSGPPNTGVLECVAEPDNADARIWVALGGLTAPPPPGGWRMINDGEFLAIDALGWVERFDTASFSRIYLELDQVSGTGDVAKTTYKPGNCAIGPSKLP